jgi:hypothetical protein
MIITVIYITSSMGIYTYSIYILGHIYEYDDEYDEGEKSIPVCIYMVIDDYIAHYVRFMYVSSICYVLLC